MHDPQIERIKSKLKLLKQTDSDFELFGAESHEYDLEPVWTPDDIKRFEDTWNIVLPEEYREFLLKVASGGAGPYYGLENPENGVYGDLDYRTELNEISKEFPYTEEWNPEDDRDSESMTEEEWAELENEYFSPKHSAGLLRISNFGCGVSINLVVKGQCYGEIWADDRANSGGIYPDHYFGNKERLTFLNWYETWLDQSLEKINTKQA